MLSTVKVQIECPTCEGDCCDADGNQDCDDGLIEIELPAKYEVCSRCNGEGSHVNPSIDGNGITADEWNGPDWDDESRKMYLSGGYDVPCESCGGMRVMPMVDVDRLSPAQVTQYEAHCKREAEIAQWDAEDRYTRRMESGGY